jgi:hypothetical protein
MIAKSTDYGLAVTDPSLLRVANTPNTQFLLQAELKAIQAGLDYKEIKYSNGGTYNGYVKDGQREVGITTTPSGMKEKAEYHLNKLHGCGKVEYASGDRYWGEFKDG